MSTPTPASNVKIGETIQVSAGPAVVTSLSHPIDPALITIHYTLLDTASADLAGFQTFLKTDLISVG